MRRKTALVLVMALLCLSPAARSQGDAFLGASPEEMLRFFTSSGGFGDGPGSFGGDGGGGFLDMINMLAAVGNDPSGGAGGDVQESLQDAFASLGGLLGGMTGFKMPGLFSGGTGLTSGSGAAALLAGVPDRARGELLAQLQASLSGLDNLFNFPQFQDLLSESGFNVTELLDDDHPALRKAWEAGEQVEHQYCSQPRLEAGEALPTSCTGGTLTWSVDGGRCILHANGTVVCKQPRVLLVKTPPACAFKHAAPDVIVGKECKVVKEWGNTTSGLVGKKPLTTSTFDISKGWDSVPGVFQAGSFGGLHNATAALRNHTLLAALQDKLQQRPQGSPLLEEIKGLLASTVQGGSQVLTGLADRLHSKLANLPLPAPLAHLLETWEARRQQQQQP